MHGRPRERFPVCVREITAADKDALQAFVGALSPESARRRFFVAKRQLTGSELRYLTEFDRRDHVALAACRPGDPQDVLAVARAVRLAPGSPVAELAVVVRDDVQGLGLGPSLALEVIGRMRQRGMTCLHAELLSDNRHAQQLLEQIADAVGAPVTRRRDGGAVHLQLDLGSRHARSQNPVRAGSSIASRSDAR